MPPARRRAGADLVAVWWDAERGGMLVEMNVRVGKRRQHDMHSFVLAMILVVAIQRCSSVGC